jgi:hypothetical protein
MPVSAKKNPRNGSEVADDGPIRWRGPATLRPFLAPVERLHEDPANANTHDERSIAAIAASFARFGQQKPLVADDNGVIRAGNGGLRAAGERLGWTHIAVVASDLAGSELAAFALADNRVAQHAEFDFEALAGQLKALQAEGTPIDDLGWADHELEPLLAASWAPPPVGDLPGRDGDGGESAPDDRGGDYGDYPPGTRPIALDPLQRATVEEAIQAMREINQDHAMTEGRCVELICRAYLDRLDA